MKVCVAGLWHLGCVMAACFAKSGHSVAGWDPDPATVAGLKNGKAPVSEPGLDDLVRAGIEASRLSFTCSPGDAVADAEVIAIAFDTPVDKNDVADVDFVVNQVCRLMECVPDKCLFLVSSQCPVGTVARLETIASGRHAAKELRFACSPENLRLGKAISSFMNPGRILLGARSAADFETMERLFATIAAEKLRMRVESAEMSKHALNAFLAASVAFANELAELCEAVGADAKEVERALKSDPRIGPGAYLSPGAAFAGGTLARDVMFLAGLGAEHKLPMTLANAIASSNNRHKAWAERAVERKLGVGAGKAAIAVWGLTYKPGTNTLRRSLSVELCLRLAGKGFEVRAHDPSNPDLPDGLRSAIRLCPNPLEACEGADLLLVATEWPEYKDIRADEIAARMRMPAVLDPNRFLMESLGNDARIDYTAVGIAK